MELHGSVREGCCEHQESGFLPGYCTVATINVHPSADRCDLLLHKLKEKASKTNLMTCPPSIICRQFERKRFPYASPLSQVPERPSNIHPVHPPSVCPSVCLSDSILLWFPCCCVCFHPSWLQLFQDLQTSVGLSVSKLTFLLLQRRGDWWRRLLRGLR